MKLKMTVKELDELIARECDRIRDSHDPNDKGQYKKCDFVRYLLDSLPAETVITVESARGTSKRPFTFVNVGSLVECIVRLHLNAKGATEIEKVWNDDDPDGKIGCNDCEIKFSGDCHYLCTRVTGKLPVVLINCDGVSIISKSVVLNYCDGGGSLPARGLFGSRDNFMVHYLERVLGIEGGFEPTL